MNTQDIQLAVEAALNTQFVSAQSDDNVHFSLTVVSADFDGLSKIKQHKLVMDLFREQIANESIHALSLKTFTPEKWEIMQEASL